MSKKTGTLPVLG